MIAYLTDLNSDWTSSLVDCVFNVLVNDLVVPSAICVSGDLKLLRFSLDG